MTIIAGLANVQTTASYRTQIEHSSPRPVESAVVDSPLPELRHWPKIVHEPLYSFFLVPLLLLFLFVFLLLLLSLGPLLFPSASFLPLASSTLLFAVVVEVAVVFGRLVGNVETDGEVVGPFLAE